MATTKQPVLTSANDLVVNLTTRELFAALLMQGLIGKHGAGTETVASESVKAADLLIGALNAPKEVADGSKV